MLCVLLYIYRFGSFKAQHNTSIARHTKSDWTCQYIIQFCLWLTILCTNRFGYIFSNIWHYVYNYIRKCLITVNHDENINTEVKRSLQQVVEALTFSGPVVFSMGYAKASHINQNETQEPLEPWTSSDPRTHENSSPNWGAGMPETSSVISLTDQNHINNW
jgi:hypothetical protein